MLFSFLAKKLSNIIQAIFGWSVTALFGKLPRRAQLLVTVALVASLAWPVFVLGAFAPKLAGWVVAFVPLHKLIGATVLRIIWLSLAVLTPVIVGILVHIAAPLRKGGLARAAVNGYPIAIGFFLSFLVVVVTVPTIKIAAIVRRWSDEHVYLQPHDGKYDEVIECLVEAVRRAGHQPTISDAPRHMVLATSIMRTFARGAVAPFVSNTLRRVTSDGLMIYLYPADLLLRGTPSTVARVRAMFGRTKIDKYAYLVASPESQSIADELSRITKILEDTSDNGALLPTRLMQCYQRLMHLDIPYDEFVALDLVARRVERRLLSQGLVGPNSLPIDQVGDALIEADEARHRTLSAARRVAGRPEAPWAPPPRVR
ncbi:MAG: hypothetical protein JO257_13535 [Deltaproteobacteria bacterium]|nr:hypothetical protein [Deltaproteobacteria bacterium]